MQTSPNRPTVVKEKPSRKLLHRLVENNLIKRLSHDEYRDKVRSVYGGPKGALLATASMLSLHEPLGDRMLRSRTFDLRGLRSILDVGSGAGQLAKHVIKYADRDAKLMCVDLSLPMLRRARVRLKSDLPRFVTADLTKLPFADKSFDCITCGYVLEHVPDPRAGLQELARVMQPGGKLLLLATEDSFSGAWTSRMWCCRTYNRRELMKTCDEVGLVWAKELWFTRFHKALRAGGICVQIEKKG